MMALYEDGLIHLDDTINLNQGKWKFYDAELEDAMAHGLNLTTLEKAFEVSSNVGIAKLAQKHYNQTPEGRQRFLDKIRQFRLDKPTGVKITGEPEPYIKVPNSPEWSGITIPWMSIGYETELTPMQMLTFYGAIANNGKMMKPRLVKETQSYGVTEEVFPPEVLSREIANEETIKFAKYLLLRPVEGTQGTAKNIRTDQYRIAGKTGTAIMNFEAHLKRGEAKRYRASFAGFFPAEKPIYACVVFITNPRNGFYGGTVAAPVFRKIADKAYSRAVLSHPSINTAPVVYNAKNLPDLQVGFKQDFKRVFDYLQIPFTEEANTAWTIGRVQGDSLFLLMRNMQPDIVPNVVGMGLRDAIFLLENRKIKVKTVGVGKVKSQSIKPGRSIQSVGNEGITLVLGM
jgi:cell division protein FtsI (penicillin-binding protein 3)